MTCSIFPGSNVIRYLRIRKQKLSPRSWQDSPKPLSGKVGRLQRVRYLATASSSTSTPKPGRSRKVSQPSV